MEIYVQFWRVNFVILNWLLHSIIWHEYLELIALFHINIHNITHTHNLPRAYTWELMAMDVEKLWKFNILFCSHPSSIHWNQNVWSRNAFNILDIAIFIHESVVLWWFFLRLQTRICSSVYFPREISGNDGSFSYYFTLCGTGNVNSTPTVPP